MWLLRIEESIDELYLNENVVLIYMGRSWPPVFALHVNMFVNNVCNRLMSRCMSDGRAVPPLKCKKQQTFTGLFTAV